jgi:hypothetical protein
MEINENYVFQVDSDVVNLAYRNLPNYLIEVNENVDKEYCILYFASNDLYYPNNEVAFESSVIKRNRFEWYGSRIEKGYKHIFLRDIKKQWYLEGINSEVNSISNLATFLQKETLGFKVIAVGASAGGYAAVILGQLLNAELIYTFNGQFEINSLIHKSKPTIDPVIFRNFNNPQFKDFYDAKKFIRNPNSVYYFHSNRSKWDIEQKEHVKGTPINIISFKTSNHGLPFLKTNVPVVINLSTPGLNAYVGKTMHPLSFSLKLVGLLRTIEGLSSIGKFALNKIYIRTFQKLKI